MDIRSLPVSSRVSFLYLERIRLEREGHAVIASNEEDCVIVPVGKTSALLLGPGCVVTHAAMALCASERVTVLWVGEQGVRLYAAGHPRADGEALLRQAAIRLDPARRIASARAIWRRMFAEEMPQGRSIDQLRGLEGYRVRDLLPKIAAECGVEWRGRDGAAKDPLNHAMNVANSALYGLCEAVVLALGYSPAIGMIHDGDARSFVFDIADTVKFQTVVPLAMRTIAESAERIDARVRRACRDLFYRERLAERLVPIIEEVLNATDRH